MGKGSGEIEPLPLCSMKDGDEVAGAVRIKAMSDTPYSIRPVDTFDQPVLWEILYEALWDPPTGPRRPKSVLSHPLIAAYVQDWGSQHTDLGFLAISRDGSVAGGILSRLLLPPLEGGAFYDVATPQLGIALFPTFQNQGIGTSLFTRHLAAAAGRFPRISLGVHPENHVAIKLYKKFGFHQFAVGHGGYLNMVKDLEQHTQRGTAREEGQV